MGVELEITPAGGDTGAPINLSRRMSLIRHLVNIDGKAVLDCGCGSGQYLLEFLKYTKNAYGIEYDKEKVKAFCKKHSALTKYISCGDIEHMDFEDDSFDVVLLNEVLEHVPDQMRALQEVARVLKANGTLVLFSPNRLYPIETHKVRIKGTNKIIPPYLRFLSYLPYGVGTKVFEYSARNYFPWELRSILRDTGLVVSKHVYVWQTFENISGNSPWWLRKAAPLLRGIFLGLEKLPLIQAFGISQLLVATKSNCPRSL